MSIHFGIIYHNEINKFVIHLLKAEELHQCTAVTQKKKKTCSKILFFHNLFECVYIPTRTKGSVKRQIGFLVDMPVCTVMWIITTFSLVPQFFFYKTLKEVFFFFYIRLLLRRRLQNLPVYNIFLSLFVKHASLFSGIAE